MPRDTQKSRLYAAEVTALASLPPSPTAERYLALDTIHEHGYLYASVQSTHAYVDAIRTSAKFQRRWGYRGLSVTHNPSSSRGGHGVLYMSAIHRINERVILHEMAHNLSDFYSYAAHGPEFAATLLTLVDLVMGKPAAARLREAYRENGVKYRSGLSSVPKPDADRLAKARRVKVKRAKPTRPKSTADVAAHRAREQQPMTYEESYRAGWRGDMANGPGLRTQMRRGFDYSAWEDGALDAAAGREMYHLRGCKAHHNGEGGCGVA